jgi:hypothetical protein
MQQKDIYRSYTTIPSPSRIPLIPPTIHNLHSKSPNLQLSLPTRQNRRLNMRRLNDRRNRRLHIRHSRALTKVRAITRRVLHNTHISKVRVHNNPPPSRRAVARPGRVRKRLDPQLGDGVVDVTEYAIQVLVHVGEFFLVYADDAWGAGFVD